MIPARYAPILFGFILSGLMSCMVSGIATVRTVGLVPSLTAEWMGSWLASWAIGFPAVLIVAPITRRLVAKLVQEPRS